ncbi:basic proline-rich protein-like [Lepus europaeus]|uniref:basic proline-rich protein-like n=1 Tax=Lepus europaeus TaxID=9983 RepID=UPI002B475A7F|nr:basic proline-rich protein-like [Lepus europaeus]
MPASGTRHQRRDPSPDHTLTSPHLAPASQPLEPGPSLSLTSSAEGRDVSRPPAAGGAGKQIAPPWSRLPASRTPARSPRPSCGPGGGVTALRPEGPGLEHPPGGGQGGRILARTAGRPRSPPLPEPRPNPRGLAALLAGVHSAAPAPRDHGYLGLGLRAGPQGSMATDEVPGESNVPKRMPRKGSLRLHCTRPDLPGPPLHLPQLPLNSENAQRPPARLLRARPRAQPSPSRRHHAPTGADPARPALSRALTSPPHKPAAAAPRSARARVGV